MSLHPQPSPGRSRIVVLNRWSDDFAAYHRYIDHDAHEVAYVCTPDGAAALAASRIAHLSGCPTSSTRRPCTRPREPAARRWAASTGWSRCRSST
ncbi:hypothetical protein [Burkholderia gladioli]|uniref:hypothetical protein n=1 Tax=Burkholderia gladioli TaxID=28095 RepID=UPI003EDFCEFE